jgi:hypothetical protein
LRFFASTAASKTQARYAIICKLVKYTKLKVLAEQTPTAVHTGGLVPSEISGVGTNIGLLVHVHPGPNKQRAFKPSMLLS